MPDFPDKDIVVKNLQQTLTALQAGGGTIPESIGFAVTNAGGFADGISPGVLDKFAGYNLVYSSGAPVSVDFKYLTPKPLIDEAASELQALKAQGKKVGRSLTEATVTEDLLQNAENSVESPAALGRSSEGAAMGIALLITAATNFLRGLAEDARIRQEIEHATPEITHILDSDHDYGAMLSWDVWKDTSFDPFDAALGGDGHLASVFAGFSVYYGLTPESTNNHGIIRFGSLYAAPPSEVATRVGS